MNSYHNRIVEGFTWIIAKQQLIYALRGQL